ncbi:MAG: branched-chain amino acid ABC transporter permease [Oscillospiraceae bacterium]|nr:branched-chain amino acid ABC transporter permease [Oscillospiraceae bacterium]
MKNKNSRKAFRNIAPVCLTAGIAALVFGRGAYGAQLVCRMLISASMAAGLDIFAGLGQLSLGHAVFAAAGAYSCALISARTAGSSGIAAGLAAGTAAAVLLALVSGFALLKLRGDYLALASLGLCETGRVFMENTDFIGGAAGLYGIPKFAGPLNTFVLFCFCATVCAVFNGSKSGFISRVVAQDEEAASSIGIDVRRVKIAAFTLSACITALAGGFYGGIFGFISPRDFGCARSVDMLLAVIVGGAGTVGGPMLAAMLTEAFFAFFPSAAEPRMIIYALALIFLTIARRRRVAENGL